ncbi:MAG TPA: hypothetical protein VGD60_08175 [Candidatus Acidoferrales bacterium]
MRIALRFIAVGFFAVLCSVGVVAAQEAAAQPQASASSAAAAQPAAKPADVASPTAILAAAYDAISGPATQERDWDRARSLFLPGAHLIQSAPDKAGKYTTTVLSVDDFVAAATPYFKQNDFFERGVSTHIDRYGNIIQAFSTYESAHVKNGKPFARGINSFQLLYKDNRWWIVTIFWQEEDKDFPIPAKYAPAHKHPGAVPNH